MEKPSLKLSLLQTGPVLPDPNEFAEEIAASIRFINRNPNATPQEIPKKMLYLWCAPEDDIRNITARLEELAVSSNFLSSLIVFAHLYLRYYRTEDFADFENFIHTYGRFQTLLNSLIRIRSTRVFRTPHNVRIFDLDNIDDIIDAINRSGAF